MGAIGRTALKAYFETGDIPTEAEFIDLIDSLFNITDDTSDNQTEGVTKLLMTVAERAKIAFNALGTFDGSLIELSTSGSYTAFPMAADLVVTFAESGHVDGSVQLVDITADGTDTLTFVKPSSCILDIPLSLTNGAVLASGKHQLVILFTPGVINVQLNARQNVAAVIPTVTSMTVEDAEPNQLVWTFSEACTGTEQGIDFEVDNVDRSITYLSGSGTTSIIFTISGAAILSTDTLTAALTSGDLAAVAIPQNSVADFAEDSVTNNVASTAAYTTFDGSTNYAWGGNILDSLISSADTQFSLEFTTQNIPSSQAVRFIFKADAASTGLVTFLNSGGVFNFGWEILGGDRRTVTWDISALTLSNEIIWRIEYDGSIDTNDGLDRLSLYIDNVLFTTSKTVASSTGVLPAIGSNTYSLAFGDRVSGAGVGDNVIPFDGDVKSLKIWSDLTQTTEEVRIPTISTGTDISGNGNDFTFV